MGKIGTAIKVLLVLFLMLVFFEAGLIGSYTIVTSESPNVQELINMQIQSILGIINPDSVDKVLTKEPNVYQISNNFDVADALKNLTNADGININDMNATSYQSLNNKPIDIEIDTFGFSGVDDSSGGITIKGTPDLKIIASATATSSNKKVKVDISTIKITSVMNIN
ncbi:MAG: hypothetical protein LBT66_06740 [Methanobrevibacter sp.]|jgi:hypothetical protein|nr:hypothetical protein [Candidatus Methanovirga meridionalis]